MSAGDGARCITRDAEHQADGGGAVGVECLHSIVSRAESDEQFEHVIASSLRLRILIPGAGCLDVLGVWKESHRDVGCALSIEAVLV